MDNYLPVLSSIKLPSGDVYYFKDSWARQQIESIVTYNGYLGVTTTELYDQCTTNPIMIAGEWVTAKAGDIAIYGPKEFIFASIDINGVKIDLWQELGDISGLLELLGKMAYNDTGKVTIKPKGKVSAQLFSGAQGSINIEYTPSGEVEATFVGDTRSIQITGVPQGIVQMADIIASIDGNYKPSGTIINNVTVSKSTKDIGTIIDNGTLPVFTINTSNNGVLNADVVPAQENLSLFYDSSMISWSAGTLPTISEVAVLDNVDVTVDSTFDGTTVQITPTFSGSTTTYSGEYTLSGSISAVFSGNSSILSTTYIPSGSISQAEFTGTEEEYTVYPTVEP